MNLKTTSRTKRPYLTYTFIPEDPSIPLYTGNKYQQKIRICTTSLAETGWSSLWINQIRQPVQILVFCRIHSLPFPATSLQSALTLSRSLHSISELGISNCVNSKMKRVSKAIIQHILLSCFNGFPLIPRLGHLLPHENCPLLLQSFLPPASMCVARPLQQYIFPWKLKGQQSAHLAFSCGDGFWIVATVEAVDAALEFLSDQGFVFPAALWIGQSHPLA